MKAIETVYKDYKFRSRLEARWAVYLENMKHEWAYEPQGFELASGRYLPDFHITDFNIYIEIKPDAGEIPDPRAMQFAKDMLAEGETLLIFHGDPYSVFSQWQFPDIPREHRKDPRKWVWPKGTVSFPGLHTAKNTGLMAMANSRLFFFLMTLLMEGLTYNAAKAARRARFEHGERG